MKRTLLRVGEEMPGLGNFSAIHCYPGRVVERQTLVRVSVGPLHLSFHARFVILGKRGAEADAVELHKVHLAVHGIVTERTHIGIVPEHAISVR